MNTARKIFGSCMVVASIACFGLASRAGQAVDLLENPYSPMYGHPYRHGVVPTLEALSKMRDWEASRPESRSSIGPATSADTVSFGGGINGIGVTSGTPRVYLVFYGSQWTSAGDPHGAATYLQDLFKGIGTGGETWSGTMTQYCDGSLVAKGATSCPSGAPLVGYPSSGAFAGVWFDTSAPSPAAATTAQLEAEAVNAAAHFGNKTAASNRYVQYVIVSPSGTHPDGFNTTGANFCAWHNYASTAYGDLAYTNMPYVTDLGASCGENFVNGGSAGTLDGFSIVNGHEYAETLTDQNPPYGWTNASTEAEVGDECAWIRSGQGAAANVSMGNGAYAMQSTWSNDTNACAISHAILGNGIGTPQFTYHDKAGCNGSYDLAWTSVPTATSYKLWANYPPYTGYSLLLTTSGTSALVYAYNNPQPSDFEVEACDGASCGARSSVQGLAYYKGCP